MADPFALAALALDRLIGWPRRLYAWVGHPVGGFARIITACETRWNRPVLPDKARRLAGIATLLILLLAGGGTGWLIERAISDHAGSCAWLLLALAAFPALAQRSLFDHVLPVARALEGGDLPAARQAVAMIVGRDTDRLDETGVSRAAIESLAESFCDGVVAPLFWLVLLGLPGIWAYKAINTADSLIGHPEPPLRAFGWASARCDDLANLLPARLAAVLLCLVAGRGWRVLWRDCRKHASPNAGWPEAAMAGALRVRLGGPVDYDGASTPRPWLGEGADPSRHDVCHALDLYRRACLVLWIISGGLAWTL